MGAWTDLHRTTVGWFVLDDLLRLDVAYPALTDLLGSVLGGEAPNPAPATQASAHHSPEGSDVVNGQVVGALAVDTKGQAASRLAATASCPTGQPCRVRGW